MEALAAFGVACNVMQTIHFGLEACAACKSVWEGKSPAPQVDDHRTAIEKVAQDLQQSLPSTSQSPGSLEDPELRKVVDDIMQIAEKLKKELDSCKTTSRKKAILKSVEYMVVKRSRINKLSDSLRDLQNIMELGVLINLRAKLELHQPFVEQNLGDIDQKTQDFMQQLKAGNTALASLVDRASGDILSVVKQEAERSRVHASANTRVIEGMVVRESRTTRDHVNSSLNDHQVVQAQVNQVNDLLRSLRYPQMNARKNAPAINNNHEGTYQWIFEHDQETESNSKKAWSNFADWLRSDESVYWISGKAGSGKSSLIRQLINDNRTEDCLRQWTTDARILSAFIWSAGSDMQKSQVGLLATLLHQLLSNDEQAAAQGLLANPTLRSKQDISDWSKAELLQALKNTFDSKPIAACFFIDGLDEINASEDDGAFGLLNLLKDLVSLPNIKMCLGSREEPIFIDKLQTFPRLRLQDLTRADIRRYVEHSLDVDFVSSSVRPVTPEKLPHLVDIIVYRAKGVFLWVYLVIKSIRGGLIHYDDWERLVHRISILPMDLSGLYREMFKRLSADDQQLYRAETALFFNEVLQDSDSHLRLFSLLLRSRPSVLCSFLSGGVDITVEYVIEQCTMVRRHILAKCVGLLEVPELGKQPEKIFGLDVSFMHRSARDFLIDTNEGQHILSYDVRTPAERQCAQELSHMVYCAFAYPTDLNRLELCFDSFFDSFLHGYDRSPLLFEASLELPMLDLFSSFMQRQFACAKIDGAMLELAAMTGSSLFLTRVVGSLSSHSPSYIKNWKSKVLGCVWDRPLHANESHRFRILHWQRRVSLTSWLLREGANPNFPPSEISSSAVRMGVQQTPFVLFLQDLVFFLNLDSETRTFQNACMGLTCEFLEHGGDINTRTLQCVHPSSYFGYSWNWWNSREWPSDRTAFVEMSVCHMFYEVQVKLKEWIEGCDQPEERKGRLRLLADNRNIEPPKIVLFGKEEATSSFLPMNDETFAPSPAAVKEVEEKLHLIHSDFPLDAKGAVELLVSQGYLPQEAAMSEDPNGVLFPFASPGPEERLDYSNVDWSYKPEYDNFMAAVERWTSQNEGP